MTHPEPAPIIFIHGLFQGLDAPDAARSLSPMPVLAPDLPGYGEDQPPRPRRHLPRRRA
jgi:pimeloyl-ACP methyl ester carboxylesterase